MKRDTIRVGVVGVGAMGASHARTLLEGRVPGAMLGAVCDVDSLRLEAFASVPRFADHRDLLAWGGVDAVVVATPHKDHVVIGIDALRARRHVLVEKPIAMHKGEAERLLAAHRGRRLVFAAMFNQRTDPCYQALRDLVRGGEVGAVRRIHWTITDWFRTEAYYASGGWRATWSGEGGGVLLNQCPHNLDLFQWIFGMPSRVRGFCRFGRYHRIEVEDDVTAFFEFPDGASGVFTASTGEAPGTNRLEVAAEQGRLVVEDGRIEFLRNEVPMSRYSRIAKDFFSRPATRTVSIPLPAHRGEQHLGILKNFADAIRVGEPLVAPAADGLRSLELANAIVLSSMEDRAIDLPMDSARYTRLLKRLQRGGKRS